MDFWNWDHVKKARKQHECGYCNRTVQIGESYYRIAGVYEGGFFSHKLCERCGWVLNNLHDEREYELGGFLDDVFPLIACTDSKCEGRFGYVDNDVAADMMSIDCECECCDRKWTVDLSVEGLCRLSGQAE